MLLDAIKLKENGFSDEMNQYFVATPYDPNRPMGNIAIGKVQHCVFGALVGCYPSVASILPRALEWIDLAVSRNEKFGDNPAFYRSRMSRAKGIGSWLVKGYIDEGDWEQARIFGESAWRNEARPWTRHEVVHGGALDDYMAFSWLAGPDSWEAGIEMYEYWMGEQGKQSLSGKVSPKKFAYALCLDATGRQAIPQDKLFEAGRRMLRANLQEEWLGRGQGICAATWLKIVYDLQSEPLDPEQTLLRAYDDMPDVIQPNRGENPASRD